MRISDILRTKGASVVTIAPTEPVAALVKRLAEHNIGAVVVSGDGTSVDGIVSERDVVRSLAGGPEPLQAAVSTIMTTDVRTCLPDDSVDQLMLLMTQHRIRHLPVVTEDGEVAGIVSIGDVVKGKIGQLEFEREQLEGYITSTR
ncbi:MAG: CBS domain-containing protein [Streptosporangiales bacterium]|nr:CBS domain-containing protein [Streptosporangiales bacterium]